MLPPWILLFPHISEVQEECRSQESVYMNAKHQRDHRPLQELGYHDDRCNIRTTCVVYFRLTHAEFLVFCIQKELLGCNPVFSCKVDNYGIVSEGNYSTQVQGHRCRSGYLQHQQGKISGLSRKTKKCTC